MRCLVLVAAAIAVLCVAGCMPGDNIGGGTAGWLPAATHNHPQEKL